MLKIILILLLISCLIYSFANKNYEHMNGINSIVSTNDILTIDSLILGLSIDNPSKIMPDKIKNIIPSAYIEDGKILQNIEGPPECKILQKESDLNRTVGKIMNNAQIKIGDITTTGHAILKDYITRYTIEAFNSGAIDNSGSLIYGLFNMFEREPANNIKIDITNTAELRLLETSTTDNKVFIKIINLTDKQKINFNKVIENLALMIIKAYDDILSSKTSSADDIQSLMFTYDFTILNKIMRHMFKASIHASQKDVSLLITDSFKLLMLEEKERMNIQNMKKSTCENNTDGKINETFIQKPNTKEPVPIFCNNTVKGFIVKNNYSDYQ